VDDVEGVVLMFDIDRGMIFLFLFLWSR